MYAEGRKVECPLFFANLEKMSGFLGDKYILSIKPSPAELAVDEIDEQKIRQHLRHAIEVTKNCCVEIIMKDNHTINNNPQNVIRWCQIARQESGR